MDILRLPAPLRRLILTKPLLCCRHVSTAQSTASPSPDLPPALTLSPSTLNFYVDTSPPSPASVKSANTFFTRTPPRLVYSFPVFRSLPPSSHPEVAFIGRSNVGKSSLLNALFSRVNGDPPAHVSQRAGRTRTINGYGIGTWLADPSLSTIASPSPRGNDGERDSPKVKKPPRWKTLGPNGLVCVDMPGYGNVAREAWGVEAMKVFRARRQLRRTYVLVDAEHGAKPSDVALLALLRREGVPVRVLVSKVDKILFPHPKPYTPPVMAQRLERLAGVVAEIRARVEDASGERDWLGDILCFSARKPWPLEGAPSMHRMGISEVRWAVLEACGMEGAVS